MCLRITLLHYRSTRPIFCRAEHLSITALDVSQRSTALSYNLVISVLVIDRNNLSSIRHPIQNVPMEAFDSEAACSDSVSHSQTLNFLCEEEVCSSPSGTKYFHHHAKKYNRKKKKVGLLKSTSSGRSSNVFPYNASQSWLITTTCSKLVIIP